MNLQTLMILGAYVLGILTMGWIKSFQMKLLTQEKDEAVAARDAARVNQKRTVDAAEEVLDAERTIDRAGDLPRPHGLKLLLGDATRDPPGPGRAA